jgi:hypothetical protein
MVDRFESGGAKDVDEIQQPGHPGRHLWRVGGDRIELAPDGAGWTAWVSRAGWGGLPLVIDSHFGSEAEAVAWCERMVRTLAADLKDEAGPASIALSFTRGEKDSP